MENILNLGVQVILWLQHLGGWLTPVMKFFTFLGNTEFYLLIAPAILWCIDSRLGLRLGIFLMVNGMINTSLKVAFHDPRPYWYTDKVRVLGNAENSFGVPSGHAQNAVVVWGGLADRIKQRWAWIAAIIVMFLIGISRVYLALHFPHDVLLGWAFGAVMLGVFLRFETPVTDWIKRYPTGVQVVIVFLFSLLLILIVMLVLLTLRDWLLPVEWINNAHLAFPDEPPINPFSYHNFLSWPGAFFGLVSGYLWMSKSGGFSVKDTWWKLVLRYLLGLLGLVILYMGLGALFSDSETLLSYILRYIRYALIGFWISGLAPWLFLKCRLATSLR